MSVTAVITVKRRAIHQPPPVAGSQVHSGAGDSVLHHADPGAALLTAPPLRPRPRAEPPVGKEGTRTPWEPSPCTAGLSEAACTDTMTSLVVKDSLPPEGCGHFLLFCKWWSFFTRRWHRWTSHQEGVFLVLFCFSFSFSQGHL